MDEENAACESGCIRVSQPSHLSIAIETGEHAHLLSPCFLRARKRHSTVVTLSSAVVGSAILIARHAMLMA